VLEKISHRLSADEFLNSINRNCSEEVKGKAGFKINSCKGPFRIISFGNFAKHARRYALIWRFRVKIYNFVKVLMVLLIDKLSDRKYGLYLPPQQKALSNNLEFDITIKIQLR